jgi:uncharacterized membrane protein YeaQ/YmgE (transglycosylase-associated protein family)
MCARRSRRSPRTKWRAIEETSGSCGSVSGNGFRSDTIHGAVVTGTLPARRQVPTAFVVRERVLHSGSSSEETEEPRAEAFDRLERHAKGVSPLLAEGTLGRNLEERNGMGIIAFIVLGLIAGVIAKAIMPGDDPGGIIITAIIGIVGALLGGFVAAALFDAHPLDEFFDVSTWLTAIIGAIVLLVVYRLVVDRGHGGRTLRA